jgi:hypothetical protein
MDENEIILKTIDHEIAMCQTWSTYWQAMAVTRVATNRKIYHGTNGPEFTDQEKIEEALQTSLHHLHRMRELIDKKKQLLNKMVKTVVDSIKLEEIVEAVKSDNLDELVDLDNPIQINKPFKTNNSSKKIDEDSEDLDDLMDAFDIDSNMNNLEKELKELELDDEADIIEVEDKLYIIDRKEK